MTRQHGGVGLGLAICRELVDKMRGSISVKSTVGEGSTFTCRIPFAVLSEGKKRKRARPHDGKKGLTKPARPSPKTWKDSSRLSVLVAEDTRANQQVIRAILKQRGHQVTLVENGKAALDKLQKSDFDVIVMDIQMPVMDGLQATRSIRAMPDAGKSHVPIVAITAHAMKQDRDKCLAAGMNAYLPKPIDAQELLEVIEETYREGSEAAEQDTPAEGIPPPCSDFSKKSGETEAQEPSEPIMDLGATRKRLRGNEKLLKDLIDYFLQDSPGLFEEFGQALEAGDAERAARTAHTLKGLASNFDAHRAVAIAKEIENLVRAGNLDKAAARNEEFTRRFEELTQALKETS